MQRSIRGATTITKDTRENVITATKELLEKMLEYNSVRHENIVNIIFTTTADISSEFPAVAARELGLVDVPLLDCQQMKVKDALSLCIRIMLTYNTTRKQKEIRHIYLHGAKFLRPDLTKK
ncbi:chorismate mutase [Allofrancisella guangzhouensis]|uniref:chorismate mutase n=1 Tax=Allofrancisella guangzhouensis TaxID=594679 RepID=A0A0A8E7S0_9GAMM|nr:chorismate mutase [Allofrancisella guangzhouensis]AJC48196.1 chorismate mutase [Allofrancisella guangzhouensis]MBK2027063.1 chorismate mutase [Allofrancisella guangzhouensis]MBK2044553.1 chorismate mutase [Allofrancisella guangzhouensis]MBK2046115.1 chorismate mutase [Allofrancisella guangzhouensis]